MNWSKVAIIALIILAVAVLLFAASNEARGKSSLREFPSVEGLEYWLKLDQQDLYVSYLKADQRGEVQLTNQCEDLAFELRNRAMNYGWLLETEILTRWECHKYQEYLSGNAYVLNSNDGHYICKTVIGNEVWFIEPANDKVWLAYCLD